MAMIIGLIGMALLALGGIGVIKRRTPLLKLKRRRAAAGVLIGGLALTAVGGSLLPKSEVTLTFTPATATVKLDGQTYTQSPVRVKLTDLPYTVKASAEGYHAQSVSWDTEKQKSLHINLKPITAAERAADAAAAEAMRERTRQAAQARAAQADQASKSLDDGTFIVRCQDAVRAQLKAPSTAKFPGVLEKAAAVTTYENGNKDWSGWVDSQNSFGALLRTEFLCEYDFDNQQIELTVKN
ncbi:PEGA domain-containing protein [Deinococcus sp. Leaf326]|uniref:PEGA domain-containing protein n=1 Tax=Deinococcus sp. Leaf326 TaxID=1736338 RepID=UPI0006FBA162|nr:PEGA domain-containing protein [Deinococcus sp. Leaf326]KQQ99451.1 hypothetical protein ASF71_13920 [Deinococcus sp. Leaf326]